ncbi:hypothetical protein [Algoriphagus hitonicola]|uniref:Viral A-type inclusion protein n=1 Tax=Algoriphagus hitonicola TaxID=435880 RepID=A0A1I2X127_9BACT|nr:hypothetical protein [Algoriphagus hitonicola]SFH06737.1 hypothetical protein SAMN04487988_11543 [Algoriphagus hitonicola]
MKRITSLLILITLTFFVGCKPSLEETNAELREEVIAVHDEVMPLMGKLKSFEKQANDKINDLEQSESVDSVSVEELKALYYDLNQAYEGMFVWMRQYEIEDGEKSPEEIEAYLKEQMESVSKVNDDIKAALEKAEKHFSNQ